MDRIGHHLLDGLRPYTRTTDGQQQLLASSMTHETEVEDQPSSSGTSILQEIGNGSKGALTWTLQSGSNVHSIQFVSVHMNPLEINANRMCIAFNPHLEVV